MSDTSSRTAMEGGQRRLAMSAPSEELPEGKKGNDSYCCPNLQQKGKKGEKKRKTGNPFRSAPREDSISSRGEREGGGWESRRTLFLTIVASRAKRKVRRSCACSFGKKGKGEDSAMGGHVRTFHMEGEGIVNVSVIPSLKGRGGKEGACLTKGRKGGFSRDEEREKNTALIEKKESGYGQRSFRRLSGGKNCGASQTASFVAEKKRGGEKKHRPYVVTTREGRCFRFRRCRRGEVAKKRAYCHAI